MCNAVSVSRAYTLNSGMLLSDPLHIIAWTAQECYRKGKKKGLYFL